MGKIPHRAEEFPRLDTTTLHRIGVYSRDHPQHRFAPPAASDDVTHPENRNTSLREDTLLRIAGALEVELWPLIKQPEEASTLGQLKP